MSFFHIALAAILLATPAKSDIRLKIDEIAVGSSVTFLLEDGTRQTHHFEGRQGDTYKITYWKGRGKGLDAGIEAIGIFDLEGRMLRGKRVSGQWFTYTPHNCFRVLGLCRYTTTRADGRVWQMGRRQVATKDGFTFEEFRMENGKETVISVGYVTLDHKGMMKELSVEPGGRLIRQSMTQERADYR